MAVKITDYMLPMSDGARLCTRVIAPGDGRYPVVFQRTPYNARAEITDDVIKSAENDQFIRHGYAVVFQCCRGCFGSEGECIPYSPKERSDGLETIEWIRSLDCYNGELYFTGSSYTASVMLMLLNEPVEGLRGLAFSVQTESMYHRNFYNGMCRTFCGFTWWLAMMAKDRPKIAEDKDIFVRPYKDIMKRAVGEDVPDFTEGLMQDRYGGVWKNDPRIGVIEKLDVPILLTGGWFDYYCYGMCSMWEKLRPETRARSAFLMTPFGHDLTYREGSDYPLSGGALPPDREALWFDHVRLGVPFPYAADGAFRYYMTGENKWYNARSPYEIKPSEAFYLTAEGGMSASAPKGGERSYIYDPENPLHHELHDYMFLCDKENSHPDVLSYMSEPFTEDASYFGPVIFRLEASSDCDDTAFVFRLYLVEDGKSYNVIDGATTLLHALGSYSAGERRSFEVVSQPTAFHVKKGARIRLDVSSFSDCYVPHANTAEHFALAEKTRVAKNTVYGGESAVVLARKK